MDARWEGDATPGRGSVTMRPASRIGKPSLASARRVCSGVYRGELDCAIAVPIVPPPCYRRSAPRHVLAEVPMHRILRSHSPAPPSCSSPHARRARLRHGRRRSNDARTSPGTSGVSLADVAGKWQMSNVPCRARIPVQRTSRQPTAPARNRVPEQCQGPLQLSVDGAASSPNPEKSPPAPEEREGQDRDHDTAAGREDRRRTTTRYDTKAPTRCCSSAGAARGFPDPDHAAGERGGRLP